MAGRGRQRPPAADASRCVAGLLERCAQDPAAASRPIPFAQTQSRQQREIHGQRVPSAGQRETVPRQDWRLENQMVTRPAIHAVKLHHHPGGGRLMVRQFRGQTRDHAIARDPGQQRHRPGIQPSRLPRRHGREPSKDTSAETTQPDPSGGWRKPNGRKHANNKARNDTRNRSRG